MRFLGFTAFRLSSLFAMGPAGIDNVIRGTGTKYSYVVLLGTISKSCHTECARSPPRKVPVDQVSQPARLFESNATRLGIKPGYNPSDLTVSG